MSGFNTHGEVLASMQVNQIKKSKFDLSHTAKRTGNIGYILPCMCKDVIAGDSFDFEPNVLARFEPFAVNIMADMSISHHSFYVPHRLVWEHWNDFQSGGKDSTFNELHLPYFDFNFFGGVNNNNFICALIRYLVPHLSVTMAHYFTTLPNNLTWMPKIRVYDDSNPSTILETINPDGVQGHVWILMLETLYRGMFFGHHDSDTTLFTDQFDSFIDTQFPNLLPYINYPTIDELRAMLPSTDEFDVANSVWISTKLPYTLERDLTNRAGKAFLRMFDWLIGVNSNLSYLGYPILSIDTYDSQFQQDLLDTFKGPNNGRFLDLGFTYSGTDYKIKSGGELFLLFFSPMVGDRSLMNQVQLYYNISNHTRSVSFMNFFTDLYGNTHYNVLPLRALYKVWYEHYRDQILDTKSPECPLYDGNQSDVIGTNWKDFIYMLPLRLSSWKKDMFNTSTPTSVKNTISLQVGATSQDIFSYYKDMFGNQSVKSTPILSHDLFHAAEPLPLPNSISLESIDKARRISTFMDKIYMIGYEIQDFLYSMFGVRSSDSRLQRSEFIGGDTQRVSITPLTNTTTTAQQLSGSQTSLAQAFMDKKFMHYFCEENGTLITNVRILPDVVYPYHIDRTKLFSLPLDFPIPDFAELGMDILTKGEVVCNPVADVTMRQSGFGYTQRYPNYKFFMNNLGGEFAYNNSQDLYIFKNTQADELSDVPKLTCAFGLARFDDSPFVVSGNLSHVAKLDVLIKMSAERPLPLFLSL